MSLDPGRHWEEIYRRDDAGEVSWFEEVPRHSLELIRATGLSRDSPILDIGGGASRLVDHLVSAGYTDLTVLDISAAALALARARLAKAADSIDWIDADVTRFQPNRRYALWHDRAAFHFLVTPEDQQRYVRALKAALGPRGHVILATFGPEGPTRCSGLPVHRYSAGELCAALGSGFELKRSELVEHRTPAGRSQQFLFGWWQAVG
jgi:SAM-dependent methyltransferase